MCVLERGRAIETLVGDVGRLLLMLYRDKASIITLLEKQSERDKHWDIVSQKTWSIRRNGAALFQFNMAAAIRFRWRMNSHMMLPSQMCLQHGPLKGFWYWSSVSVFVSYIFSQTNTDFYSFIIISTYLYKGKHGICTKIKDVNLERWLPPGMNGAHGSTSGAFFIVCSHWVTLMEAFGV